MEIIAGIIIIVTFMMLMCCCRTAKRQDTQDGILLRNKNTTIADCLFAYNEYGWVSKLNDGKFNGFKKE